MDGSGGSIRVGLHTTENGQSATCKNIADYMANNAGLGTGYHMLYHPTTGDFLQLRPFNVGAGSLRNRRGGVQTNRNGKYNFQLSVVARAAEPWWELYPLPNWDEFVAWVREWGVPDQYVDQPFSSLERMSNTKWTSSASGWYGHRHVPENDHTDPGPVPAPWALKSGEAPVEPPPPAVEPYDDNEEFHRNLYFKQPMRAGDDVKWVQSYVNALPIDGIYGPITGGKVKVWQSNNDLVDDGNVGKATATKMGMPGTTQPKPPEPPPAPKYPLLSNHWYGNKRESQRNHSGYAPGENRRLPGWGGSGRTRQYQLDNANIKRVQQVIGDLQVDGLYGDKTAEAVKKIQASNKLVKDGLIGPKTWGVLDW